jgi:hypothetical protein
MILLDQMASNCKQHATLVLIVLSLIKHTHMLLLASTPLLQSEYC